MRRLRPASPLKTPLRTPPTRKTQRASPHQNRRLRSPGRRSMGDGRARRGAGGTPVAIRGGSVSKSATKAARAGIGREEKRGISTILLARSGSIRAFVADLDNPPPRTGRGGRSPVERRPGQTSGRGTTGRTTTTTGTLAANGAHGPRRRPPRTTPGAETCTSHSKVQFQPSFSRAKCTSRRRSGPAAAAVDRDDDPAVHDDPDLQAAASGKKGSMRAQLDKIHLSSHNVSSARQNPPELDSCELSSHNVS